MHPTHPEDLETLPLQHTARPVAALARDYPHGHRIARHRHRRAQLLHSLSGVVTVASDAGTWVVPPDRGVWLPAGMSHAVRITGAVRMRTVFVEPGARPDLRADCVVVDVSPLLRALLDAATQLPVDYKLGGREERIMELILDEIRALPILALDIRFPADPALAALCRRILKRPETPVSLAGGAAWLDISTRSLSRLFQHETGMSFAQWVRRARLLRSLDALAAGTPIVDVALSLGYDSPSAFSAMFRRTLGLSPSQYFGHDRP